MWRDTARCSLLSFEGFLHERLGPALGFMPDVFSVGAYLPRYVPLRYCRLVPPAFRRKNIRLPRDHYLGHRRYFVTILCRARRPLLVGETARRVIATLREIAAQHRFSIYTYCAMPDHLHFLAVGLSVDSDLLEFVKHFKLCCTIAPSRRPQQPLWHKSFYDHILRHDEANAAVAFYILMNPVRAGLCADPHGYEFTGSFAEDSPDHHHEAPWFPPWHSRL